MSCIRTLCVAVIAMSFTPCALALSLEDLVKPTDDLLKYMPVARDETWHSIKEISGKRVEFDRIVHLEKRDNRLLGHAVSRFQENNGVYDSGLRVLSQEEKITDAEYAKLANKSTNYWTTNTKTGKVKREIIENGKSTVDIFDYDANSLFVSGDFLSSLILAGKFKSFEADVISTAGKYSMNLEAKETPDPLSLSAKYEFPGEFKTGLRQALKQKAARVYIMGLNGIKSAFFPHKFYFIFNNQGRFVGFYGGDPKKSPSYSYLVTKSL